MCGICGFIGKGDRTDLERMTAVMASRGPDDQGLWSDPQQGIYLGHRRLAIIDIPGGRQPMWTADGRLGVVFNGIIYNHMEIRRELTKKGHVFLTDHSDTEVLLHGYRQWGTGLPEKLNGMWAFAILDRKTGRLFMSRDRFGKKPLYYTFQRRTFAFASELTSLMRHRLVDASISRLSLKKFYAYGYIPAPRSLYEGVGKLPGGHNLLFNLQDRSMKTWQYWDFILEPFEELPKNPVEEWGGQIRELLCRAVKRRLVSDVPIGVFLSGGIDSSAITAYASEGLGDCKLKTFSIGFTEKSFDETAFSGQIAKRYRTDHYMRVFSIEKARAQLEAITGYLDEPIGDSSILPTYLLCRMTRENVTVALSGEGGDELFAGYDPFRALSIAKLYSAVVPRSVHPALRTLAGLLPVSHRNISFDFKVKRALRGLNYPEILWNAVWLGPLEPAQLDAFFEEPTDIQQVYSEAIRCWDSCPQENMVDKTLQFFTKLYLQDDILAKIDRAGMMNSLEVRSPFLDIELVDFVRKIPAAWKFRNGRTKYLLKKILEPVLPHSIIYRPKKGFGAPIGRWFKEGKLQWDADTGIESTSSRFFRNIRKLHAEGKVDERLFLWNTWILSEMMKKPQKVTPGGKAVENRGNPPADR